MPNPSKKFLSKTERQMSAYKKASDEFYSREASARDRYADPPEVEYGSNINRGATRPSSQVKKAKMSPRKLGKMGAAINTGMTAQRSKILAAIQRLPMSQQRKIYKALEGYATD
jgi:hypothetical protein